MVLGMKPPASCQTDIAALAQTRHADAAAVVLHRAGFLSVVFSVLSLVPMSAFLYMELCTIAAYG